MTDALQPLDAMAALVLEDGRTWGDVAADWQLADARAIFDPNGPRWHYLTRPRGGSKTTDLAGVALAWLATEAAPGARGYVVAVDADQAALLVDAAAGLVARTPAIRSSVTVGAMKLTGRSGATVEVLAADGGSAFGLRPSLLIADELAQWGSTRNARRVWSALVSSAHKVKGSRLVVLTSAGEPGHWSFDVLKGARKDSKRWRVSEVPGPLPWIDPAELEAQRPLLRESEFARLHLNQWTASEDRIASPDDLRACVTLEGPLAYQPGNAYVIGVDIGLKKDRTVAAICHREKITTDDTVTGHRVVLDRMAVWSGSRAQPVELEHVENWLAQAVESYPGARITLDPWQAVGMAQRLRVRGVYVEEFTFSAQSVGRLAQTLHLAIRNHTLALPDDEDLFDELANIRLRETSPGVLRTEHDPDKHDDRGIALGLAAITLLDRPASTFEILFPDAPVTALDGSEMPHLVGPYAMQQKDLFARQVPGW